MCREAYQIRAPFDVAELPTEFGLANGSTTSRSHNPMVKFRGEERQQKSEWK